jgi:aryl-alcohol dehydrogenase-like predicted oxidoreductase
MKINKIFGIDKKVKCVGLGTWGLGGKSYGPINKRKAEKILNKSINLGVNFFDTSDLYSNVEKLLGNTIKCKKKIIIATKCGLLPHTNWDMPEKFTLSHIKNSIISSMKRLKTNHIDILQLHSPSKKVLYSNKFKKIINLLEKFRLKGKIGIHGVSVRDPMDGIFLINNYKEIKVIQVNFNLLDQRANDIGLFKLAKRKKVNIIVRTPLCFGFLSSKIKKKKNFSKTDHRKRWSDEQITLWNLGRKLFFKKKPHDCTMSQFSINFCSSFEGVTCVIPGSMNEKQLKENVESSRKKNITKKTINKLKTLYQSINWMADVNKIKLKKINSI